MVMRLNGLRLLRLGPRTYEGLLLLGSCRGPEPLVAEKPSLLLMLRKSGRRVARLPAVMARPCSVSDQMAMSTVAPKSVRLPTVNRTVS